MPYRKPSSNRRPLNLSAIVVIALCAVALGLIALIFVIDEAQKQNAYLALWSVTGAIQLTAASTSPSITRRK